MSKNIVLIGLMGAGKTSVGRALAYKLRYTFVDIDEIIESREKMKISDIFALKGEPYFRQIEIDTILEFSGKQFQVISTGGGAPQNLVNIDNLKTNGILFYLYAPVNELYNRLLNEIENRPMLKTENPLQKLSELLEKREPFYLKADYKIDTVKKSPEMVVEEIINLI